MNHYRKGGTMRKAVVAVYGTLKTGYGNHYYLTRPGVKYLGEAVSVDKFALGHSAFPAVSPDQKGGQILVELYAVPSRVLKDLDRLEGYPSFYDRKLFQFKLKDVIVPAYLYYFKDYRGSVSFQWELPERGIFSWTRNGWIPVNLPALV